MTEAENFENLNQKTAENEQGNPQIEVSFGQVKEGNRKGSCRYEFYFGSKKMVLYFQSLGSYVYVDTFIENIPGAERISGETTAIYEKVSELCQEIADSRKQRVHYVFKTRYPQLAKWALNKGQEIFRWDKAEKLDERAEEGKLMDESVQFLAEKDYFPSRQQSI